MTLDTRIVRMFFQQREEKNRKSDLVVANGNVFFMNDLINLINVLDFKWLFRVKSQLKQYLYDVKCIKIYVVWPLAIPI